MAIAPTASWKYLFATVSLPNFLCVRAEIIKCWIRELFIVRRAPVLTEWTRRVVGSSRNQLCSARKLRIRNARGGRKHESPGSRADKSR